MIKPFEGKATIDKLSTAEGLSYLTYLYRDKGMTDELVAKELGVSRKTLHNYRNKNEKIKNAVNLGKAIMDIQVENTLLRKALEGDVTSIIFWLKNRKPSKWNAADRVESIQEVIVIKDDI